MMISVTPRKAVELSGLSRTNLYRLMKSGELPSHKVRGRRLIVYSDLLALVANAPRKLGAADADRT